ncbi:MAG TPA: hypothetical protein VH020_01125 [Stellaceae bacterium]|jgi:hypothetical protein|nr:hypothetical protein [Stellaceae bacterium]
MGEPIVQFRAADGIAEPLDTEANFSESDDAYMKQFEWLRGDERHYLALGSRPAQFG